MGSGERKKTFGLGVGPDTTLNATPFSVPTSIHRWISGDGMYTSLGHP